MCAAKQIMIKGGDDEGRADCRNTVQREVGVMRDLNDHGAFVELLGFVEVDRRAADYRAADSMWVFMELVGGGELFDRLIDSGCLREREARPYLTSILEGLRHAHTKGIVHRDIKLENVMLTIDGGPNAAKVIDLGLAERVPVRKDGTLEPRTLYDPVGSKSYRAPEILASGGYQGPPVDVWALGIVTFSLVSGFFPLDEAKPTDWRFARLQKDTAAGVSPCECIYAMYKRKCPFSRGFRELVDSMLTIPPTKRATLEELAAHPWFASEIAMRAKAARGEADDDDDAPVYRSLGGALDDDDDDVYRGMGDGLPDVPFEPPADAMMPRRQKAKIQISSMLPA